jgi:hypothetical protein
VPAHAGSGLEAHEPVGLGGGGVDDLPDVDAHAVGEHRKLVAERDVDRAEDVLEELRQLGGRGRGDPHEVVAHKPVERFGTLGARLGEAPEDLRGVAQREVGGTGSTRSGLRARWKSRPAARPDSSRRGRIRSRVVPG